MSVFLRKRAIALRARAKARAGQRLSESERINLKWLNQYEPRSTPQFRETTKRLGKQAQLNLLRQGQRVGGTTEKGVRIAPRYGGKPQTKISKQELARSKSFTHAEQVK